MVRDPKRIDITIEALRECWKRNPDMRLGQLIYYINKSNNPDIFYIEDDKWLVWIKNNL